MKPVLVRDLSGDRTDLSSTEEASLNFHLPSLVNLCAVQERAQISAKFNERATFGPARNLTFQLEDIMGRDGTVKSL
jgi:hypothetical protein